MDEKYVLNKPEHLENEDDADELPWELREEGEVDSSYLEKKMIDDEEFEEYVAPPKTEEEEKEEKLQQAYETIKHHAPVMPGLGMVEPIRPPEEDVELDPDEIPWELKEEEEEGEEE